MATTTDISGESDYGPLTQTVTSSAIQIEVNPKRTYWIQNNGVTTDGSTAAAINIRGSVATKSAPPTSGLPAAESPVFTALNDNFVVLAGKVLPVGPGVHRIKLLAASEVTVTICPSPSSLGLF